MISRLVLYSLAETPADTLLTRLHALGLTGETIHRDGTTHYLPGPEFLRHIILVGCSPSLALTPETAEGDNLCSLHFPDSSTQAHFYCSQNPQAPKCRKCKSTLQDWANKTTCWKQNPEQTFQCHQCNQVLTADKVNWQRSAAVARSRIEILGIYANEGIPSEQLLNTLNDCSALAWDFFYSWRFP